MSECFDISADKLAKYQKAMGVISSMRWEKTRWSLVRVPNERFAQQANVSYEKIMDMFFDACTQIDWKTESERYNRIAERLNKGSRLHILARNTDLSFEFGDNPWVPETPWNDETNIPSGEIYVTPLWNTVKGYIN